MVDVFKKGKIHPEVNPPISKKLVKRENLENDPRKFLQRSLNSRYFLILGEPGTGKTTLIQSTILNLQEPKGVVHFVCPSNVKEFAKNLAEHLNCELYPFKLRDIVVPNAIRKEQDNHSEYSNWNLLSMQLLNTARNYMKKYKRPIVLILDQVDRIAMNDQKFIEILQDFAKVCADEGSLIVVFIASEGLVPQIMRSRSSRESDKGLDLLDSEELESDESDTGSSSAVTEAVGGIPDEMSDASGKKRKTGETLHKIQNVARELSNHCC
nr:11351_t:CDS:2 [Entrophospora candida]